MIRTIFIRKCARKEKTQYEEFKEADCYYHGYRSYDSMYSNGCNRVSYFTGVKVTSGKNAGTYSVKITGKGKYAGKVSSSYTIKKATQKKLTVKNGYKTKKASTFKKKAKSYTFKVSGVKDKAKVTYQRSSKKIVV